MLTVNATEAIIDTLNFNHTDHVRFLRVDKAGPDEAACLSDVECATRLGRRNFHRNGSG